MDPKSVFETGKSAFDLLKAVVALIGDQKLRKSESDRLLELYLTLQEFSEALSDYFSFLRTLNSDEHHDIPSTIWIGKKLATLVATKHYAAYKLADRLDIRIRPYDYPLYELIKGYKGSVSKSMGYGPEEVRAHWAYRSLLRAQLSKKHFTLTYGFKWDGEHFFVGEIEVGNNQRFLEFCELHERSAPALLTILTAIEGFAKEKAIEQFHLAEKPNPAVQGTLRDKAAQRP